MSTLGAPPRPHPQTVLIGLDATYRENWAFRMKEWAESQGWRGIQDHHMLRARFRAQLLEEIDSILVAQADEPRWPPLALEHVPEVNDGRWTWIGLFGWSGKTIEDWDTARAAATARLGWAQPPLYGHTYEHSTAKFEGRVFDKMAIINYNRLKGGPDPCGYKAWARMGDYMRAVDAVIQATGHSDRERELDDEIRTFQLERRKRHIRAFVFTQELRQVGTPSLPSPVVSVVLDALDERLDGPGYQGDDRNWADRMGDWARTRGWTALSDDSVLRARFRAQLIEEIDAVFAVQAAPRWPPPELQLLPTTVRDDTIKWKGLFGWGGKSINDWDTARKAAAERSGWAEQPRYAHTHGHRAARFEELVFDKMAMMAHENGNGGYQASAKLRDYIVAVDAVMRVFGDRDALSAFIDEIRVFQALHADRM